jgi:predicted nucleotidyltransferase
MNQVLMKAFDEVVELLKKDDRCLGGWHFGSMARGLDDKYSDVDPVFLVDGDYFEEFDSDLPKVFEQICDEVVIYWPETFNSDEIKNYGVDIKIKDNIYQFDIFLLNSHKIDSWFCKIHYTDSQIKDIIFDRTGDIKKLLANAPKGEIYNKDVLYIIETYWHHIHMITKYFLRKDYFKLIKNFDILMKAHIELLLAEYDCITWGGWDSKVKYIPMEKKEHLKKYFASSEIEQMKLNLKESLEYFSLDAKEICKSKKIKYPQHVENCIKTEFLKL